MKKVDKCSYGSFIILFSLCLMGCPFGNCSKYFTLTGKVSDINGVGVSDVEVIYIDPKGQSKLVATTDLDGGYSYVWGPSIDLRTSHLEFHKGGFNTVATSDQPIGDGDGTCADQILNRDVILDRE